MKRMQQVIGYTTIFFMLIAGQVFSQNFTKILDGPITAAGGYSQGSSWIDYDNDGDEDLFITNGSASLLGPQHVNFFYQNMGDGTLIPYFNSTIDSDSGNYTCSAWGDFDNDGFVDVYIGQRDDTPDRLYRNLGNGNFEPVYDSLWAERALFTNSASWVDYDNDHDLDLFVGHALFLDNILYRNDISDGGTFTRIEEGALVDDGTSTISAAWADYDNDGDMDVVTTNFNVLNLYTNQGNGIFTESELHAGAIYFAASWGDYDNDNYLDLIVNRVGGTAGVNFLFHNNGAGGLELNTSSPIASDSLVRSNGISWGDYDNDGDLDLFATNVDGPESFYYLNDGIGNFVRVTDGTLYEIQGRGCTSADYDNDGDLDVLVTNGVFTAPFENYLYRNDGNSFSWAKIKLTGVYSNKTAIGARIRVKANIFGADIWQSREVAQSTTYDGHNSLVQHFGFGDASEIDSLVITWPASGMEQVFGNVPVNHLLNISEPDTVIVGVNSKDMSVPQNFFLAQNYPNPFNPSTTIEYSLTKANEVNLEIFNVLGEKVVTLVSEKQAAGLHRVTVDATTLRSGVYFYRLTVNGASQSRKMILLQ